MKSISQEFIYGYNYPKLSNKFIKQEQICNYAVSRNSELSSGPQNPELSISEMLCGNDYHSHF